MNKEVATSFLKAQVGFGAAIKCATNPHFKSKYADLASCIEAVIDSLNNNGFSLMQLTHPDETGVTVETVFLHSSGEQISGGKIHVPAEKNNPQGYGSALTYARRYGLMASCGMAPEDDDGNAASKPKEAKKPVQEAPKMTPDQYFFNIEGASSKEEIAKILKEACIVHSDFKDDFRAEATKRKLELEGSK